YAGRTDRTCLDLPSLAMVDPPSLPSRSPSASPSLHRSTTLLGGHPMRSNALRTVLGALLALTSACPTLALERYTYVTQWGVRDVPPGNFNFARGITTDAAGNVYVADSGNNRIQKFTSTGALLAVWGSSGSGPSQFDYPGAIAVDSSAVYV